MRWDDPTVSKILVIHSFIHSFIHCRTFIWLTPPGPYRAKTCRERELALDHIHTFLTTWHGGHPRMTNQLHDGAISDTTRTWKTITFAHSFITTRLIWEEWLWWPNDIRGTCGLKAPWHLSYGRGKPRKKSHPETCPDQGSNPGPLRDRHAYYRLIHNGRPEIFF